VAQLLTGDRGVEEDLVHAQRHPHPHRRSIRRVRPVWVVLGRDILHCPGDHAERGNACLASCQPQRDVVTLLDLIAIPGDRPVLELVAIGEEFPHPPLGRVALHQPMRHDAPFHSDPHPGKLIHHSQVRR
jgi:hypothetical protein